MSTSSWPPSPTTSGPPPRADGADTAAVIGRWAAGRVREGIEASLEALGVHFDVWTSEARLHDEGWVARAVERLRERGHVYEQDGAVWFRSTAFGDDKDRVIYRSDRRTDLLRGRHRLRDREARPRLRPPHLHLGRRPPRDGRPRPQRRRGDGLRPRGRPGPALFVGPLRPRRPGDLDEQARGRVHHPRRAARRGRRRRRALVLRVARGRRPRSTSTSSWPRSSRTRTRSTTSSTRTPGSPRSCARRPTPGWRPPTTWPGTLSGAPEAALARAIVRFPEVVEDAVAAEETQGVTAYATELATTFHGFYRDARVVDPDEPASFRGTPRPGRGGPDHARQRARIAGDLGARVDVAGRSGDPGGARAGPPPRASDLGGGPLPALDATLDEALCLERGVLAGEMDVALADGLDAGEARCTGRRCTATRRPSAWD